MTRSNKEDRTMSNALVNSQVSGISQSRDIEILVDRIISASRRNPRFQTDPVAAIYSTWMELGSEISAHMSAIRSEERKSTKAG
mgnify:CR=1 FL=1